MEIIQAIIIFFSVFINLKKASEKKLNVSSNSVIHGATTVGYTTVHQSTIKSSNFLIVRGFTSLLKIFHSYGDFTITGELMLNISVFCQLFFILIVILLEVSDFTPLLNFLVT